MFCVWRGVYVGVLGGGIVGDVVGVLGCGIVCDIVGAFGGCYWMFDWVCDWVYYVLMLLTRVYSVVYIVQSVCVYLSTTQTHLHTTHHLHTLPTCRCMSLKYAGTVMTACLTGRPKYASAVSFILVNTNAPI